MIAGALLVMWLGPLAGIGQDAPLPSQPWNTESARRHYQAWGIVPENPEHFVRFGMALALAEDWPQSALYLAHGLKLNPKDALAHGALGNVLIKLGDYQKAVVHFQEALSLDSANAHFRRGLAQARRLQENEQVALRLAELVRANPEDVQARLNLGYALANADKPREAAEQLEAALRIQPGNADARFHLGVMLDKAGEREQAIAAYREALRLRPGWTLVRRELAWLLATGPDHSESASAEAVRLAESVCGQATCRDPVSLDALAAAYASAGRFDAAVGAAGKAVRLALEAGNHGFAEQSRRRLELYQEGRPYRLP